MIDLYAHNKIAYEAASDQLARTGKAAVIQPTGTGKSFVAFKLMEDRPQERFCWMAPSEYIWRTQLENLQKAGGEEPQNVTFLTYAKLMQMTAQERAVLQPDVIVLDEFHRCGAEEWGKGVNALLADYPEADLLGLTATPIRYLDQQRDMADELFDGCIAHQLTLGEAIVQGILPAPKYVMALYAFQQELVRYTRRAHKIGGAAGQKAEQIIDQLRRRLEEADGVDVIFQKHMQNKHGKYILFCADREHMQSIRRRLPQWLNHVDAKPHIYEVYAESGEAAKAFDDFKQDECNHIKVLLCIDMFNEGVHVSGLSGVILCRPTISPIVYKQQIGRALSALKDGTPVIFDLVNNVENLYSISAIRNEMDTVTRFYANEHREDEIIHSGFDLVDEVRECRELFEQLEATLTASWDIMYAEATAYFRENGNLNVPRRYRTESNFALGSWIQTQRSVRRGARSGDLSEEQIAKLDDIGMVWESINEIGWENGYRHAASYYEQFGHLNVSSRYVSEDGYRLGGWIHNMRAAEKGLTHGAQLSLERRRRLESIGMVWSYVDYAFERGYAAAARFHVQNGHLKIPSQYTDEDGFKLGVWLRTIRSRKAELTDEQRQRLDALDMIWETAFSQQWEKTYQQAVLYKQEHRNLDVPVAYEAEGIRLRRWLDHQRELYQKGKLAAERKEKLNALGMVWQLEDSWTTNFKSAQRFYQENGHLNIPMTVITEQGAWLGKWVYLQRKAREQGKLSGEQIHALESIGMEWQLQSDILWKNRCDDLLAYCHQHGSIENVRKEIPGSEGVRWRNWYLRQRKYEAQGKLSNWQQEMLNQIP